MSDIKTLSTDPARAQFAPYLPAFDAKALSVASIHFDTMADLAAYVPATKPTGAHCDSAWDKGGTFSGTRNIAEALGYARDGWQVGADRARPLLERIKTTRPTRRTMARWDVAGATPSIPRYLAGNPLNMRAMATAASNRQPVITIVSNWSTPAGVDAKVFECAAVAAAAICDRLEDAGYRVEIIAGRRCASVPSREKTPAHVADIFVRIKAPEDSMDLARVAFGIGHPSTLRRLSFAMTATHPNFRAATHYGQGYAVDFGDLEMPPGSYTIPANRRIEDACGTDPMKTFDYVLSNLIAQGCPGLE